MASSTETLTLKTAIGNYGHTRPLKDGRVGARGIRLEQVEIAPISATFYRMVPDVELDVAEMVLATYLCARTFGKPFTAIPIFPVRQFHHAGLVYNAKSGIETPKDLEGRRVGVRTYTVSRGVWARGVLALDYGVDLDKVTWVIEDDEHLAEYQAPPNVALMRGASIEKMLVEGEIDAAIGVAQSISPDIKPLIPDARNAEAEWYKRTGIYPMNHTLVIRDSLLAAHPWVAQELFAAFKSARDLYLDQLKAGGQTALEDEAMLRMKSIVGDNPLPYGVEPNRKALEIAIQIACDQHIIPRKLNPQEIFVSDTLDLE